MTELIKQILCRFVGHNITAVWEYYDGYYSCCNQCKASIKLVDKLGKKLQ